LLEWKGAAKIALITIFNNKPRQMKFHIRSNLLFLSWEFLKQIKYTMGAVMPERISKFLPAKVISSGISLCVLSMNSVISTGTRTMCTRVNFFTSMLSVNLLPLLVTNNKIIDRIAGAMPIISLGGIVEVSWNTSLKERMPVTASQTTKITAVVALIFTALINNKKVKITVSKKL
jgi:hypothetical protein